MSHRLILRHDLIVRPGKRVPGREKQEQGGKTTETLHWREFVREIIRITAEIKEESPFGAGPNECKRDRLHEE